MKAPYVPNYEREFHRRHAVSAVISVVKAKRGTEETNRRVEAILEREGDAAKDAYLDKLARAIVGILC